MKSFHCFDDFSDFDGFIKYRESQMPGKSKRIVGLSIGLRAIAVAHIHTTASGAMTTDRLGISDIPPGAIDDSGVIDTDVVSRTVRDLLIANDVRAKETVLVISANSVITRLLTLPSMPENEMREVLRGEVEDYAILSGDEPVLDFQVVEAASPQGVSSRGMGDFPHSSRGMGDFPHSSRGMGDFPHRQRVKILVVAAPKRLISSYKAVVKAANLRLSAIETVPLAVLRALISGQLSVQMHDASRGMGDFPHPAMLVSVEESTGTIAVVGDEVIQFVHSIEIGSDALSRDGKALEELADEVRSSLSYYQTASPQERRIENVILFMDGADSGHISETLSRYLSMPVSNPRLLEIPAYAQGYGGFSPFGDHTMNYGLSSCAAIGGAARATTGNNDGNIDLLRSQKLETARSRNKVSIFLLCLFSMILLSVCANFLLEAKANSMMKRLIQQNGGGSGIQALEEMSSIEADAARLEAQVDMTRTIINSTKRVDWAEILREISAIIPKTVWLTDFSWKEGDDATFDGVALSYDSVFKFRDTLTDSPYFGPVTLVSIQSSKIRDHSLVRFEMGCGVRGRIEF
jgi:Tfp pilus assembly PilM family ATPase